MYSDSREFSSENCYSKRWQLKTKNNRASSDYEQLYGRKQAIITGNWKDGRINLHPNFPGLRTCNDNTAWVDSSHTRRFESSQATQARGFTPFRDYAREDGLRDALSKMRIHQKSLPNLDTCGTQGMKWISQDQKDQGYYTQDTSSVGTVESVGQPVMRSINGSFRDGSGEIFRRTVKQIDLREPPLPEFGIVQSRTKSVKKYFIHDDSDIDSTSSDDDQFPEISGDFLVSEDEPLHSTWKRTVADSYHDDSELEKDSRFSPSGYKDVKSVEPKYLRHSAGNEPDPFVKWYTVRLRRRDIQLTARSVLTLAHFVEIFGAHPKSMIYNSLGNVVVQVQNEDQGSILSRTTSLGGFEIETRPHSTYNNVTGIIESEKLWHDGCSTKIVEQLAHEGVISASIYDPIIREDGTVSLAIEITFGNRSRLPISVMTRAGFHLDVLVRVFPPQQCLHCFRFGHDMPQCRELDAICGNCSSFRDSHVQPCKRLTRCANCGSSRHGALSHQCFARYKSWRINIGAFTNNFSFMEAKRWVDQDVEDCQRRGGDYVKEFPLTSRYFLIVPLGNSSGKAPVPRLRTTSEPNDPTIRNGIKCQYPEMFAITDPGEYMNCSQLLDYYNTNDSTLGIVHEKTKKVVPRSPADSRSPEALRSQLDKSLPCSQRPSLLKKPFTADEENYLTCPNPGSMSPPSWQLSFNGNTDEFIDPMSLLIHVTNGFSFKTLNTEKLIKVDANIGLVKFLAINLRFVSRCWQDPKGRSTVNSTLPALNSVAKGSSAACTDDHQSNIICRKLVEGDTFDDCTDVYAASRCKLFARGRECKKNCEKVHRLPKQDGIRCISKKLGQCLYGQECNFLHDSSEEDNNPDAADDVQGCNGYMDRSYDSKQVHHDGSGSGYFNGCSSSDGSNSSEDDDGPSTAMAVRPLIGLFNRSRNWVP